MTKEMVYQNLIFISEMRDPCTNASSTQIMSRNLLFGFSKISSNLIFVPIIDSELFLGNIKDYYGLYCSEIIPVHEITRNRQKPIKGLGSMLLATIKSNKNIIPKDLMDRIKENTIVISQSPSIDAAVIGNVIKKMFPKVYYIQYWGDPLTLSLITPEQYSFKRFLHKYIEKKLHKVPDKIAYGTKSLCNAQKKLFPKTVNKFIAAGVSYCPNNIESDNHNDKILFGYFGNYYSEIRDIQPFYEAVKECPDIDAIICGKGDIELESQHNISVLKRVPQIEVPQMESRLDVIVCLLNKTGVQIPGKIFYQTNTSKIIIVITDGPNEDAIVKELKETKRFLFCKNDKNDILKMISQIKEGKVRGGKYDYECFEPAEVCRKLIEDSPIIER